jgi:hypothetical protein
VTVPPVTPTLPYALNATGQSATRYAVSTYLENTMPPMLDAFRQNLHLSIEQLPNPERITPGYEGLWNVEVYPTIAVGVGNSRNFSRQGFTDDGGSLYEITYPVSIYYWVMAEGDEAAVISIGERDIYAAVIRSLIVTRASFGTAGQAPDGKALVRADESTLEEIPYEPSYTTHGRYIAAGQTNFDVTSTERSTLTAIGQALTVSATGTIVGATQPLPGTISLGDGS